MNTFSAFPKQILVLVGLLALSFTSRLSATDSAVANAHMKRGDYAAAYREYRGLAEVGYPDYQNQVAAMHAAGQSVTINKVLAHVWYTLSASQWSQDAIQAKIVLERELSSEQLARSKELAKRYAAEYVAPYRPPSWSLD